MDDLGTLDAVAQAALVRAGEASPVELVDAAIARIEKVNPELNAVIHERFDKARAEAAGDLPEGPLRGVPMLVKDFDGMTAGDPYHAGTQFLRDANFVAPLDSYFHARLKAGGLVLLGRTNCSELGLVTTVEPAAYGPARNPWNTEHSTGGSSGGSAAAVASRMVPLAHAGDGGGSIRIPASECGIFGLFPSRGRHSFGPLWADNWDGLVRWHVVTRTVRDSAVALDLTNGTMPGDPYGAPTPVRPYADEVGADPGRLRIGVLTTPGDPNVAVHPDCVAAVEAAAQLLGSLGHDVGPAQLDLFEDEAVMADLTMHFTNAFFTWVAAEVAELEEWVGAPVTEGSVEPLTWFAAEAGRSITGLQVEQALAAFNRVTRDAAAWWAAGNDLLLTPTMPEPPPRLGEFTSTTDDPLHGLLRASRTVQFTIPFNITGQPAMSVPLHWNDEGLPIGVQLVAAYGREDLLLRVASQLEEAAPWIHRTPSIVA